jgi:uncharacterized protein (TIGR02145 family)
MSSLAAGALASCRGVRTVVDIDGNRYPVVAIGAQEWLAANLRVTRAPNGAPLTAHRPNGAAATVSQFGLLYNWADARRACMAGWHLPSDDEWSMLAQHLGPAAGGALKDTIAWLAPNAGATNRVGYSARPAGYWNEEGFDNLFGRATVFWSATPQDTHFVWTRSLSASHDSLRRVTQHPNYGLSVRCVRDRR